MTSGQKQLFCRDVASGDPWSPPIALGGKLLKLARYLPLLVPIILFLNSLYIPPIIASDSGVGFLALRSMLDHGAFNCITTPDPANIANDVVTFLTWFSPGQYLVPGIFIWLGTSYGLALSLTTLIATLIGVGGWIQVARSFAVSSFVLFVLVLGLTTFGYVTLLFRWYWGGELLLFATAPWSLYAMRWSATKSPILCFTISLLSAALLFFAKLNGLIVFATNVVAISLLALVNQRRLDSSALAMWVASAIAALCFMMFWVARGPVPAGGSTFSFSWLPIWFSVAGAAFSGIFDFEYLWFLRHFWPGTVSDFWIGIGSSYVLGPIGLLLMVWVWLRLRYTRYRDAAVLLLTIISLYAIVVAAEIYVSEDAFQARYLRYAGILFFLLLLMAVDEWRVPLVKGLLCAVVILLGFSGLRYYATRAYGPIAGYYDPMTKISHDISPAILEYLRSEATRHNFQRPIAVIASPAAALSLPRFRFLTGPGAGCVDGWEMASWRCDGRWMGYTGGATWMGRAEKIFVVLPEKMLLNGKAEAALRLFTGYEFDNWKQTNLDGMIIYTQ